MTVTGGHVARSLAYDRMRSVRWGQWVGLGTLGLVLGQANLYGRAAPFAWALVILVWHRRRSNFAPALLGASMGTVLGVGPAAGILTALLGAALPLLPHRTWPEWVRAACGGLGGAGLFALGLGLEGPSLLLVGLAATLGSVTVVLGERAAHWLEGSSEERESSALVMGGYCLAAVLAGTEAMHWGWWDPGLMLGTAAVLLAAAVGGPAGGALAGGMLGLTLVMRGTTAPGWVGALVVAGCAAGIGARQHWRVSGAGFLLGLFLAVTFLRDGPAMAGDLWSVGLGAATIAFWPDGLFQLGKGWTERLAGPDRETAIRRRVAMMAHVLDHMGRLFALADPPEPAPANAVELVVQDACRGCSLQRQCWERDFYRSYRGVQELVARAEAGRVGPIHLDEYLAEHCIKPDRLAESANRAQTSIQHKHRQHAQLTEVRQLTRVQLQGMAALMTQMAEDQRPAVPKRPLRAPLRFTVGIAERPRSAGEVSGDTPLVQRLDEGRVIIGLSDGMGTGVDAAFESGAAVDLLQEMLTAGFSQTMAVRAVNTALYLRSPKEQFATLDLALMDFAARETELVKVGAPPTFLKRAGRVEIIRGEGVPVGILRDVAVLPMYHTIEAGDVWVMASDGALGSPTAAGEERLKRFLGELPVGAADFMAETLLALMLDTVPAESETPRDDALLLVVTVVDSRHAASYRMGEQVVGEWRRVTSARASRWAPSGHETRGSPG